MIESVPIPLSDRVSALVAEGGGTLTGAQVAKRLGFSRAWVYQELRRRPDFPQPINFGCRPLLYLSNEVDAWKRRHDEGK